jgi:polyisoprenoid-binding protein YceI
VLALLLVACQTTPLPEAAPSAPASQVSPSGKRYAVDRQASEIRLLVYRDGPMARFGHNHVLQGPVHGEIRLADSVAASGFVIEIPVQSLQVDAPLARSEEGAEFASTVSDQARLGTRDNLLGPDVLDAAQHSLIRIESDALLGPRWNPSVSARITLRGKSSAVNFSAAVLEQSGVLTVVANFQLRQSDLGLTPFSVLGGAIRVQDRIDVRVRLLARPIAD